MKLKLLLTTTFFSFLGIHAQDFNQSQWLWSAVAENYSLIEQQPQGFVDRNNNYFVIGNFRDATTTVQGTTIQNTSSASATTQGDSYIAKFDANGTLSNILHFSGSQNEQINSIVYDGNDHYFIAGYFTGTFQIGNTTMENTDPDGAKVFIAKLTLDGTPVWVKEFPHYMGGSFLAYKNNYLYIAANYAPDQFSFAGLTLPVAGYNPSIQFMDKTLVAKFDAGNGNLVWAASSRYTGPPTTTMSDRIGAQMRAMTVDNNGNVFITGEFFSKSVTFGSISLNRTSNSNASLFYVRYDSAGAVAWAKTATIGSSSDTRVYDLTVDAENNVYLVGMVYSSSINFDGTTLQFPGNYGGYMVKFGTAGNLIWAKKAAISSDQAPGTNMNAWSRFGKLYVDAQGNIYVGGNFYHYVNFAPNFVYNLDNAYYNFLAKYDTQGTIQSCEIYPIPANGVSNLKVLNSDPDNFSVISMASTDVQLNNLAIPTDQKQIIYIAKKGEAAMGTAAFGTEKFGVYPNPTNGKLFVNHKELLSADTRFTLYDLNGRQIFNIKKAAVGEKGIDVSGLTGGVYVLSIEDSSGKVKEHVKFVKNNSFQ